MIDAAHDLVRIAGIEPGLEAGLLGELAYPETFRIVDLNHSHRSPAGMRVAVARSRPTGPHDGGGRSCSALFAGQCCPPFTPGGAGSAEAVLALDQVTALAAGAGSERRNRQVAQASGKSPSLGARKP
jgi:hypothetical protein